MIPFMYSLYCWWPFRLSSIWELLKVMELWTFSVLSIYPEELQNHRAFNCSSSADIAKQFAKMIILIFNNTALYEYSSSFISLSTVGTISHSDMCAVVSQSSFILHFHDG